MPILKQLVSSSSQSKRRSRSDLTAEMISAPLGDFRHTMHVGRGGDAFGDTSFLSSRSGEPPQDAATTQSSSPKQGLLSRTFRSSKRTQSASRADKSSNDKKALSVVAPSPGDSPAHVKTAISLPYIADEDAGGRGGVALRLPKSVSSSPAKRVPEADPDRKPPNGATAPLARDTEQYERNFGELTDLPMSSLVAPAPRSGMKHAESIMSFHIDLGPSMLGDILSVMDKKSSDDPDLGYEEGYSSPVSRALSDPEEEFYPHGNALEPRRIPTEAYKPEILRPDSYSLSSSESTEEKLRNHVDDDTDSMKTGSPRAVDDRDFTYMDEDEEDDEIRV